MRISLVFFVQVEDGDKLTALTEPQQVFVDLDDDAMDALKRLEGMKDELDSTFGLTRSMLAEAEAEFASAVAKVQPFFNSAALAAGRVARMNVQAHLSPPPDLSNV